MNRMSTPYRRFYRWGLEMKYDMGLYFSGLVFVKGIFNWAQGRLTVDSLTLLEMLLAALLFAAAESCLFPRHREQQSLARNTVLWALLAQVVFLGGGAALGWFPGAPWWAALILIAVLELSLWAMWYGLHIALKQDSRLLNEKLLEYQSRGGA